MRPERKVAIAASILVSLLSGCGGAATGEPTVADSRRDSSLEARMDAISGRLRGLGYEPTDWSRAGELDPGEHRIESLDIAADNRVVLVVIGDSTDANLDLAVLGPRGEIEAEDAAADRRAAVEIAVAAAATYKVRISNSSADAPTRYLSQAFGASSTTDPAPLFGLFDDDLPGSAPSWEDVEARAAALSMSAGEIARTVGVGRGERLDERIELEAGQCYLFVAQGSAGIDDVAIRLWADESLLVADLAGRPTAWVLHCAEASVGVKLSIEVIAGSGRLRIAGFTAAREDVDPALVGPPLLPHEPALTIEAAMRWTDQQLARAGYDPAEVLLECEIGVGERRRREVRLESGECAVVSALSGPGVQDLDLEILDPDGKLVAGDSTLGPSALVRFCASTAGGHEVSLVGRGGRGAAVMMVSRLPEIALPVSGVDLPREAREAAAVFGRRALEPLGEIEPVTRTANDDRQTWSAQVELEQDHCYGFAAAANGTTVERLELRDPAGDVVALWKRDGLPATLTACASTAGSYEIRVVLADRTGDSPPLLLLFGVEIAAAIKLGSS